MYSILYASVACDDSFVVLKGYKYSRHKTTLVHFDAYGEVLFQKTYRHIISMFGMLRDDEVIVPNFPSDKIDIINLLTGEVK